MKKNSEMVTKKTWKEFRETGLLLIINQFLHIFGWSIVFNYDHYDKEKDDGDITEVFPARVKFRGFSNESTGENYVKVSKYMVDKAEELLKEASED